MQQIGKYQVLKILGQGGMGTVYEALDPHIRRRVAVKTMTPGLADDPVLRQRFLREAQAAGGLRHRNIVTVYDLGEDQGQPYIAMEMVEGADLEQVIRAREPVSLEWKLAVLRQVCEALAHAHRHGIVHRDVKP
ncbi:MAG TPA: serine/threonine-protein kinase, partial [Vicinamibacteria bacterium]